MSEPLVDTPRRELMLFRLNRLAATSGQPLIRYCEGRYGISRREWRLIVVLSLRGPTSSSELAKRAGLQPGPTSRAISMLTEKGLAARTLQPNDRRKVTIQLTPRGKEIFDALYPVVQDLNERLLSALTDDERRVLELLVSKLQERVATWVTDIELPKADRRHGHRGAGL